MLKILFICHGNICRSAAAEMVLRQMTEERRDLRIASAAATREEIGNDIYPPMKKALRASGYTCRAHSARQTVQSDYRAWDYIIGMERLNMSYMHRILGGDPEGKVKLLMDFTGRAEDIDDPWYTGDFGGVYRQIVRGCEALLRELGY